jgi:hypothetical protein
MDCGLSSRGEFAVKLKSILTTRHIQKAVYWQIVWEWEDSLAEILELECVERRPHLFGATSSKLDRLIFRSLIYPYSQWLLGRKDLPALCFHMNPPHVHGALTRNDVVPIVIDCWRNELDRIPAMFHEQKAIFVCNAEAVTLLKAVSPSLPVHYLPVSLPARHIPTHVPDKDIDLLCYSRTHPDLVSWAQRFADEHPEIRFCRTGTHEGRPILYDRDVKTEIGESRDSVLHVLSRSKIVLQSSPGLHPEGIQRTGGFNPVTPRFLEAAANCCHMVGIYPRNEDFEKMKIADVCSRVSSYSEFHESVEQLLGTPFGETELARNQSFLLRNTTERRAEEIQSVLEAIQK